MNQYKFVWHVVNSIVTKFLEDKGIYPYPAEENDCYVWLYKWNKNHQLNISMDFTEGNFSVRYVNPILKEPYFLEFFVTEENFQSKIIAKLNELNF